MDTVQTAVSKEDALLKDMDEHNAAGDALPASKTTACAIGDNENLVPAVDNDIIVGSGKVAGLHIAAPSDSENGDDLLDKIEEVVKEDESNGAIAVDKSIAESSEQDFLKQLEEAEAEARAAREARHKKAEEKPPIDLTEESVSSSDEKEKAGNSLGKDIGDEPDQAHVVDDNAADSTNIDLVRNKKSEPIRIDSIDSDIEFIPSESNEKTADPENSDVIEISQSETIKENLKESAGNSASDASAKADDVVSKSLENGEIDLTNAEDSEISSEKDEVEITPNEAESLSGVVSSSSANDADIVETKKVAENIQNEPEAIDQSEKHKDAEETCEIASSEPTGSSEAESKEVEDVISLESGTSEEEQAIKDSAVEQENVSDEVSQSAQSSQKESEKATVSDTQRMSVDDGSDIVETMEVDEEEKMDVDMVETISDEEMPVVSETENLTSEDKKLSEESNLPSSSEAEAAPEKETINAVSESVSSTEVENQASNATKSTDEKSEEPKEEKHMPDNSSPETQPVESELTPAQETIEDPEPDLPSTEEVIDDVEPENEEKETIEEVDDVGVSETNEVTSIELLPEKEENTATQEVEKVELGKEDESTIVCSSKEDLEETKPVLLAKKENEDNNEADAISPSKSSDKITPTSTTDKIEKADQTKDQIVQSSDSTSIIKDELDVKPSKVSEKQEDIAKLGTSKPENKLLTNTIKLGGGVKSLENSPVAASAANVFNSTPISRQFDISSENVSKISEGHEEGNRTTEDHSTAHSTEECTGTSTKTEEESGTTTSSEATHQTTDSVTKFLNVVKQFNGTTSEDSDASTNKMIKLPQEKPSTTMSSDLLEKAFESCPKSSQYEISVWYDEHDIRFLSVEKLGPIKQINTMDSTSAGESSEKLSSNGSVSSLAPFPLGNRTSGMLSGSSTSSKTPDDKPKDPATKRAQYTATGVVDLCKFMIEEFTKIKNKYEPPTTPPSSKVSSEVHKDDPSTPKAKVTGSSKKAVSKGKSTSPPENETETPTKKADKRTLKRALTKSQSDDEEESKPKQTKQSKSQPSTSKSQDTPSKSAVETSLYCCLAKWVDKKYYAGRVTEEKAGNKFVVLFEDGASKVLPRESIVFGEDDILPLKDHSVYALLDDDYELGTVKEIDKSGEKVLYTVDIDGKEIKVSASDIYLTDQQAKTIQNQKDVTSTPSSSNKNAVDSPTEKSSPGAASRSTRKRPATSPITPEAGFSGGLTKRGGRKPKRSRAETRLSESTDLSDSPETVAPASPESALEAIEGVQPELQKTPKESEISRMMIISDYMKTDPAADFGALIGSMPKSKILFKNKCFLLTCTVAQKLPPYVVNAGKASKSNIEHHQFSSIPFIKENLRKQIENGGGKVYDHFEDVPKNKYKQCKLIASRPCTTAKYVQCLAADIPAVLHEWIIQSCDKNLLLDYKKYNLPSGWSIIHDKYINWSIGKSLDHRQSNKPFLKENILIASEHPDFVTFWSRVCKMAGGTMRYIKSLNDVTPTTTGYLVTDLDFPQVIKSKAEHYGIPIVSTLWIVQSLILGKICEPHAHIKLTQFYHDDDL